MRTGSCLNALFKGDQERESAWFGLSARNLKLPLLTTLTVLGRLAARRFYQQGA